MAATVGPVSGQRARSARGIFWQMVVKSTIQVALLPRIAANTRGCYQGGPYRTRTNRATGGVVNL